LGNLGAVLFSPPLSRKGAGTQRPLLVEGISDVGQVFLGISFGMLFVGFYSARADRANRADSLAERFYPCPFSRIKEDRRWKPAEA
jgi:hypothetical protein